MTLQQLEYLLKVQELQHFGRAAKACHVTQPTLSMQIAKCEEQLGVVIFDRSKNPIMVTEIGEKILKQAKKTILEFGRISKILEMEGGDLWQGDFSVGVIPTLAPYLIPLFVGEFAKRFPKVNLLIEELKTEEIILALEEDRIDCGLLVTPLHHNQIVERVLFYEKFLVYPSLNHELLKRKKIDMNKLRLEDIWLLKEGHCLRDQVLNICHIHDQGQSNIQFESGSLETLKKIVDKNDGYTLLPEMATFGLSPRDKTRLRDFQKPIPHREVSLVHSRLFLKEGLINSLQSIILDNLPKELSSHKKTPLIIPID